MILRTCIALCLCLALVSGDYGSKPKPKVIIKEAGPSREYRWAGYTRHYPRSIPRPLIIHKWNPYTDPIYTASWVAHKPSKGHSHGGNHGKHAPTKGGHGPIKGGHSKGHEIPHGFGPPKHSTVSGGYSGDVHGGHDSGFSNGHGGGFSDSGFGGGFSDNGHGGGFVDSYTGDVSQGIGGGFSDGHDGGSIGDTYNADFSQGIGGLPLATIDVGGGLADGYNSQFNQGAGGDFSGGHSDEFSQGFGGGISNDYDADFSQGQGIADFSQGQSIYTDDFSQGQGIGDFSQGQGIGDFSQGQGIGDFSQGQSIYTDDFSQGIGFATVNIGDSADFVHSGIVDSVELGAGHFNGDSHFGGSEGLSQAYVSPSAHGNGQVFQAVGGQVFPDINGQVFPDYGGGGQQYQDLDPRIPNIPVVQAFSSGDSDEQFRGIDQVHQQQVVPLVYPPQSPPLPLENEGGNTFNNNLVF